MGKDMALKGARVLSWGMSVPWMATPTSLKTGMDICLEIIREENGSAALNLADYITLQKISRDSEPETLDDLDFVPHAVQADTGTIPDWGKGTGIEVVNGTAIIPIQGMIFRYADFFSMLCGGLTTQQIAKNLRNAQNDPAIHSIVLEIDSPGGEADGIAELARQIRATSQIKPVIAHGDGDVASAAYYLASAAGKIVVSPSSMIGCIGVISSIPNPDLEEGPQSRIPLVSTKSPKKHIDTKTPEGRAQLQTWVDDLCEVFITDVAMFRGTTAKDVEKNYGQGDLFIAAKALKIGMVDAIGGLDDILAGIQAERQAETPAATGTTGGKKMTSVWDRLKAAMSGEADPELEATLEGLLAPAVVGMPIHNPPPAVVSQVAPIHHNAGIPEEAPQVSWQDSPEYKAMQAQLDQYAAQEREATQARRQEAAAGWSREIVLSGRAFPAEQAALASAYLDAAQDDEEFGVREGQESRVSRLQALVALRPSNDPLRETVPVIPAGTENETPQLRLLENITETPDPKAEKEFGGEERIRVLSMTAAGREKLRQEGVALPS